jgi:tetratricopeptide (TPR) repeat protein
VLRYASIFQHIENINIQSASPNSKCHELLIRIKWSLEKGLNEQAWELIDMVVDIAEKFELMPTLIYLNELLLSHGLGPLDNVDGYIHEYMKILAERAGSNTLTKEIHGKRNAETIETSTAWYYREKRELLNAYTRYEYSFALQKALLLREKVDSLNALNVTSIKVESYLMLAKIYVCISETEMAVNYLKLAKHHSLPEYNDIINELLFYCYLRSKNEMALENLLKHAPYTTSRKYSIRWKLYKAGFLYLKGEFKESINLLQNERGIWGDRSGIVIGYKLLEIMNLILIKDYDWFELKLDTFRKLLQRFPDTGFKRFHVILYLLKKISGSNYATEQLVKTEKDIINALQSGKGEYHWNPLGPEIIRFDEWLLDFSSGIIANVAERETVPGKNVLQQSRMAK